CRRACRSCIEEGTLEIGFRRWLSYGQAHAAIRWWLVTFLAVLGARLVWLLVDHTPMLFIGDSEAYLATAVDGYIPTDRSFTYGLLLRIVAVNVHSLGPLLVLQMASGV